MMYPHMLSPALLALHLRLHTIQLREFPGRLSKDPLVELRLQQPLWHLLFDLLLIGFPFISE